MQAFKQQYLILYAMPYRIEDKETGQINEGISIEYIPRNNLDPSTDEGRNVRGYRTAKGNLPISCQTKIGPFPALYDVTLEMVSNADRKMEIRPKDVDLVATVNLSWDKPK